MKSSLTEDSDAVVPTKKFYRKPALRVYGYIPTMTGTSGMMGSLNDGVGTMSNKTH
jgi:hypothetical protein